MPYSGPASAYGVIGKTLSAYFDKVNAEGGVNGRSIKFISYDDAYSPPKTVELVHKLVEQDRVLLVFGSVGGATSAAVRPYLNQSKVPQLFNASGPAMWDQPQEFPWTMGWQPNYQTEGRIYAQYLLENYPRGKIAVLYQDDAFGNDALKGLEGRSRRQDADRRRALQGHGRFDRSADGQAESLGLRHLRQFHDAEICHHRHPPRRRNRLETGSTARGGVQLGRGDAARRAGEFGRRVVGRLLSRARRSIDRQRSRVPGMVGVHGPLCVEPVQERRPDFLQLRAGPDHGRGAAPIRRRPVP